MRSSKDADPLQLTIRGPCTLQVSRADGEQALSGGGGLWIYGRAELRVCALGVRIHLAHGRESVFRCIPLYLVLYRVGTLYLDAMPRIRLYSHRTCCILIVSDGFPTRAPRYIRNTSKYSGIHQDTVLTENPPKFDRTPPPTPCGPLRGGAAAPVT